MDLKERNISIRRRRIISIGRKTIELNLTWNPDQYRAQYPDRILTDLPPIILMNPHHFRRLIQRCVGKRDSPNRASGRMVGRNAYKRGVGLSGLNKIAE